MDKISLCQVRFDGLRCLDNFVLDLAQTNVVTGFNGTGKSTIVEGIQLLRRAGAPASFLRPLIDFHGGFDSLLGVGRSSITFGLRARSKTRQLDYSVTVADFEGLAIEQESLFAESEGGRVQLLERSVKRARVFVEASEEWVDIRGFRGADLLVSAFGIDPPNSGIGDILDALRGIDVQVPFDTTPLWVAKEQNRPTMRLSRPGASNTGLRRLGINLPNLYGQLRKSSIWERVMGSIRVGLGDEIEDVGAIPTANGELMLGVKYRQHKRVIGSDALSDGTLDYLALVALAHEMKTKSLVAFDEPDLHLHPTLLPRIVDMFEEVAERTPVVVTTHSDRLLDALLFPQNSVLVLGLNQERRTVLRRPNKQLLEQWLSSYKGYGEIRGEDLEQQLLKD